MKSEPSNLLIGLIQERIERLKQTVGSFPKNQHALFGEVLEGFSTVLKEFQEAGEKLRIEQNRQEELIKLASFPELNPNPIVETDLNGHIRYRNSAAQRLFPDLRAAGFEHPWLVGLERLFEVVDHKEENTHVREVKVGDSWFAQSIHFVNDGKLLRIYGLDITERKKSEEDLRKREESFRALAENSPDIIERFDEEIRHVYVNPLAAKLHGISAEALIGKTNQEIGVPEHYCRFWKERIQTVFQTSQTIEEENEFPTTGGKRIYQSRFVPEMAKDGTVTSVLMVSRDVTDRKQAEEMLQEYQKAIENSQDMIAVVDRNYRYLIANKAFLKYRGVGREQIIGRSVSEVLGKDVFEGLIKRNLDACLQGQVVQYEMKCTYPEFGERDLSVSYFPIESPEGINRVTSVIRDITELKRMEETLRESEMRRRLSSQILIAQENERKLIAREIHDGFGSQLATAKLRVENFLQQIGNNVTGRAEESLESVIAILQESIQEVRRIQMNLRPSILDDLGILPTIEWFCRAIEETYPNIHIEKRIIVKEKDVSTPLKIVIYRILQEAMNNIVKHSEGDLVRLSLGETEGKVELLVQDNGQGFDLKEVLNSASSGRGLGLAGIRERAELSGGSFSIETAKGTGTIIRVSWPIEQPSS